MLVLPFLLGSDERCKYRNAMLAPTHEPAQPAPGMKTRDASGLFPLGENEELVAETVSMKFRNKIEVGAKGGTQSLLQLRCQTLHGRIDDLHGFFFLHGGYLA